ncbi:MAG: efflux RND transporter periplasmic adaptor subunit [Hyphomicrobium sp.]
MNQNHVRRYRGILLGAAILSLFGGTLAAGAWGHYAQRQQTLASAEQRRAFVPLVRVAAVKAASEELVVSLPATTSAYAAANIFARASGYIDTRAADIGDHVKAGQLLATIVAPELDHQIAQAEATLAQLQSALHQAQANQKLASVTWGRDKPLVEEGWLPRQQGTVDVQTLRANDAAVDVAQSNVVAQQAQLQVLQQQKAYQRVVAPFEGVITQRNIDIGSLVQADAVNSTFMFTILQGNVIRTQVYVPQDSAAGAAPGIDAVVRVPELPDRIFSGKVTRIANALQPARARCWSRSISPTPTVRCRRAYIAPPSSTFRARPRASRSRRAQSSSTRTACRSPSSKAASRICARSPSHAIAASSSTSMTA